MFFKSIHKRNQTIMIQNYQSQLSELSQQDQLQQSDQISQIPQNIFEYHQLKKQQMKKEHHLLINNLFKTPAGTIHSKNSSLSNLHQPQLKILEPQQQSIRKQQSNSNCTLSSNINTPITQCHKIRFKSLSNCNNTYHKTIEIEKVKENLSKLTYSVKTIESRNHDEDIGISSKRVLMSIKNPQLQKQKIKVKVNNPNFQSNNTQICQDKILPQGKFFAKPLKTIQKKKISLNQQNQPQIQKGPVIMFEKIQKRKTENNQTQKASHLRMKMQQYEQFIQKNRKRQQISRRSSINQVQNSENSRVQTKMNQIPFTVSRNPYQSTQKISLSNLLGNINNFEDFNKLHQIDPETQKKRMPLTFLLQNSFNSGANRMNNNIFANKINKMFGKQQSFSIPKKKLSQNLQKEIINFKRYKDIQKEIIYSRQKENYYL